MKHLFILCILLLAFLAGTPVSSADFQKGVDAAKKGDFATALKELTPLAEKGDAEALHNLGWIYSDGLQDYKTAIKWYTLAAEQGVASSQFNLGLMYQNGEAVLQDYKAAAKWYTLAAKQGMARAQDNLGVMYANGTGVLQDLVRAHMWFNIAASSGYKNAFENRGKVAKKMTPAQIEKAQDLARECVEKNYKYC